MSPGGTAEMFNRPSGTQINFTLLFPAINGWAIVRRPSRGEAARSYTKQRSLTIKVRPGNFRLRNSRCNRGGRNRNQALWCRPCLRRKRYRICCLRSQDSRRVGSYRFFPSYRPPSLSSSSKFELPVVWRKTLAHSAAGLEAINGRSPYPDCIKLLHRPSYSA